MEFNPTLKIRASNLGISYFKSTGYLFGIFMLIPYQKWLVILIILIDLFILQLFFRFYWHNFRRNKLSENAFYFIIAGLIGNSFDFVVFRYVRDFIILPWIKATNLADIFLITGLFLILIEFWINIEFRKNLLKLKSLKQEWKLLFSLFEFVVQDIRRFMHR